MRNVLFLLFACLVIVHGQQRWLQRARVKNYEEFYTSLMQETVSRIEQIGFCNFKMVNVTQNVNQQMYKWLVNGTVVYTNGFLISIQKIDVTNMQQIVSNPTVNGVQAPMATVTGQLNFRDAKIGYDLIYTPNDDGPVQRYTGDFTHVLINWQIRILKDLTTKVVTVTLTPATSGGLIRMVYRPANNVTEVLSRLFFPFNNADGVRTWATVMEPILLDILENKIHFPEVCFSHC